MRQGYQAPVLPAPAAWSLPAPQAADVEGLSETFGDTHLTTLIRRAVEGNLDVRTTRSRLQEARATVRSSRPPLRPSVDATGLPRASGTGSEAGLAGTAQSYGLSLDACWELDIFGGVRSAVDAATATAEARDADAQDVVVSLAAEVALDYIEIRSLQRRIAIAQSNVELQRQTLDLTRFRAQAGLATELCAVHEPQFVN